MVRFSRTLWWRFTLGQFTMPANQFFCSHLGTPTLFSVEMVLLLMVTPEGFRALYTSETSPDSTVIGAVIVLYDPRSCANRDHFHGYRYCDSSWLDFRKMYNPYAVGQYVNNERLPG